MFPIPASVVFLLIACTAHAQQVIGGVHAPEAVTLRITQVADVAEHDHKVNETTTESTSGYEVIAESDTVHYHLRCLVHEKEVVIGTWHERTWDENFLETFRPVCPEAFHVGERVVFYSLDNLVWLSRTNGRSVFTHGSGWKPSYGDAPKNNRFEFFKFETGLTPPGFNPDVREVWFEKQYSILSEEEKSTSRSRTK